MKVWTGILVVVLFWTFWVLFAWLLFVSGVAKDFLETFLLTIAVMLSLTGIGVMSYIVYTYVVG